MAAAAMTDGQWSTSPERRTFSLSPDPKQREQSEPPVGKWQTGIYSFQVSPEACPTFAPLPRGNVCLPL